MLDPFVTKHIAAFSPYFSGSLIFSPRLLQSLPKSGTFVSRGELSWDAKFPVLKLRQY